MSEYDGDLDKDLVTTDIVGGADNNNGKPGLFGHLFSLDKECKHDILNVLQYSFISLIPCVLLNKLIQYHIPEACPNKGSMEITLEIVIQLVVLLVGLWFIDRFTTYFNTYSTTSYPKHTILFFTLGLITILISIQSKLGEKINILFDRLLTYINGSTTHMSGSSKSKYKQSNASSSSMPDVQILGKMNNNNNLQMDTTNIANLPVINQSLQSGPIQPSMFNQSSQQQQSGMVGSRYDTPILTSDEPMPANMGMGSFGTAW
jgi:hypothetical protein